MAKFVYKMQNILDIKYKLENQAKTEYTNAKNKLDEENQKMQAIVLKKNNYEYKLTKLVSSKLDILEIKACKLGIEIAQEEIKQQALQIILAEKNLEHAREKLYEIMNDRKIHEKLKENAFEDFKKELSASESKEIDELVSYTYGNKTR